MKKRPLQQIIKELREHPDVFYFVIESENKDKLRETTYEQFQDAEEELFTVQSLNHLLTQLLKRDKLKAVKTR